MVTIENVAALAEALKNIQPYQLAESEAEKKAMKQAVKLIRAAYAPDKLQEKIAKLTREMEIINICRSDSLVSAPVNPALDQELLEADQARENLYLELSQAKMMKKVCTPHTLEQKLQYKKVLRAVLIEAIYGNRDAQLAKAAAADYVNLVKEIPNSERAQEEQFEAQVLLGSARMMTGAYKDPAFFKDILETFKTHFKDTTDLHLRYLKSVADLYAGMCFNRLKQIEQVIPHYEKAIDELESLTKITNRFDAQLAENYHAMAVVRLNKKEYTEALWYVDKALGWYKIDSEARGKTHPILPIAQLTDARIKFELGDVVQAIKIATTAGKSQRDNKFDADLPKTLNYLGDFFSAVACKISATHPDHATVFLTQSIGYYDEALKRKREQDIPETDPIIQNNIKDLDQARAALEEVITNAALKEVVAKLESVSTQPTVSPSELARLREITAESQKPQPFLPQSAASEEKAEHYKPKPM